MPWETYSSFVGGSYNLPVRVYPTDATSTVMWESSDDTVVSVDATGTVKYLKAGVATVTATTINGLTASCEITVKETTLIALDEEKTVTMLGSEDPASGYTTYAFTPEEEGLYQVYSYDIVKADGADFTPDPHVELYAGDPNLIDSDDDDGGDYNFLLQFEAQAGETYFFDISPYREDAIGTYKIKVVKTVSATSIILSETEFSLDEGDTNELEATLDPINAVEEDVEWFSSDETVATVNSSGKVTAVSDGTATITAKVASGVSTTATVTVIGAKVIMADATYTVTDVDNELTDYTKYKFIPTVSGVYRFESFNAVGEMDPYIKLYDNADQLLRYNDDNGDSSHFILDYELQADTVYYPIVFMQADLDGSADFKVTKLDESTFPALTLDTDTEAESVNEGANIYFRLVPTAGGTYSFTSSTAEGSSLDPKGVLFDAQWNELICVDDSIDCNYTFEWDLVAGETYYLKTSFYASNVIGTHTVRVEQTAMAGDVNADGVINMIDAFQVYAAASSGDISDNVQTYGDMNEDGVINMMDAFAVYKIASGS